MESTIAIIIAVATGVIGGFIGAVPFFVVRNRIKVKMQKDGLAGIIYGMLATLVSFVILVALILVCRLLASDYLLPFSLTAIAVFIITMIVYTAKLMRR